MPPNGPEGLELGDDGAIHRFWAWYALVHSDRDLGDVRAFLEVLKRYEAER